MHCCGCGKKETNKRTVDPTSFKCTECITKVITGTNSSSHMNDGGMNEQYRNSNFNASQPYTYVYEGTGNLNDLSHLGNYQPMSNGTTGTTTINPTTPVSELITADLITIINSKITSTFKSLEEKIEKSTDIKVATLENKLNGKICNLENQIELLERDNEKKMRRQYYFEEHYMQYAKKTK